MKWYIVALLAFVHNFCKSTVGLENLTRYGNVKQSSRYLHYGAKNTIDGNKNQSWAGESCGHTAAGKSKAWWRLDIEQLATIHRVIIYHRLERPDRLNGFYIIIGDTFSPEKPKEGHECFHDIYDNVMPNVTQDITCNYVGKFVVIYNERNITDAFLELCEVEVFGCLLGKYGNTCKNCSTHCQGQICDIVTGRCNCSHGYHGPTCDDECAQGQFGEKCQFKCNCLNGADCNHIDGSCPYGRCAAGWLLNNCSKECAHGRFGESCRFTCNCLNGASCNHVDGSCPQGLCAAGWDLNNCSKACPKGTYGSNCVANCGGCIDDMCEAEFGNCTKYGCKQDFTGHNCDVQVSQQDRLKGVSFEVFGVCISVVIILAVLTVLTLVCYFRRKFKQSSQLYEDIRLNSGQRTNEDQVYSELGQNSC